MKTPLNGYIKIYRQMLDWEWYDDVNTKAVFLHLLLTANFEDNRWHGIEVKKGDAITSIPSLAKTLRLSERNVRTAIKHLKATGEVTVKAYAKFSVITVVNYNLYQENPGNNGENSNSQIPTKQVGDRQSDGQVTGKRRTSDGQVTGKRQHLKNDKKEKNDKNDKNDIYSSTYVDENEPKTENSKENFDFQAVISLFNSICTSLPKIQKLTENRKRNIRNADKQLNSDFKSFFEKVERSDFLSGRKTDWKASFDWILNPQNLVKVIEGNYENKSKSQSNYSPNSEWGDGLPF